MSIKRTILIETALVVGVLTAGISTASSAHAAPLPFLVQAADKTTADVKIESKVKVERSVTSDTGEIKTTLHDPNDVKVVPGDKLVFINAFKNIGSSPATGFVVNNPVHPAVSFTEVDEVWAEVSVDGGKTFGKLADLLVTEPGEAAAEVEVEAAAAPVADIEREAQPADVTHVKWVFAEPIAAGESGELRFRGVVK
ncbi:hypothetical protein [Parasphingorhabdus halotolerans]|uniref:Uncharacterized protein n=1 Tax=Parasphingorhabdus halotolerans TaxID=2725558 RepID=A0A6H2DMV5_9SPHN|nr:hypothetical protein [Parasphingorhabdus halotolerans]QJB70002.1 hypothetical protein HF685_12480 [Parasphingorhabdus halotolerans]